ncbi:hypothetical protein DFH11DRAFT_1571594 [Phellopilus nigrolimitatus]|nr:hypothetical protein DFH11DRAFT_1571594 [Phellopilus nigrolimitatus]
MVRNTFLASLILPPAPQPGGLGLYQITGLLTPPPTPPPTSPQLGRLGIYEPETHLGDTGSVDTTISGSSPTEAGEMTTRSEVNEETQLEAQASLTPATAPEHTSKESNDEENDENQGSLVDRSPFVHSPTLHSSLLPALVPEISFESVVVSAPFSTFAGQVSLFRKKTMRPLPCLSPEAKGIKRQRSDSLRSSSVDVPSKRHRGQRYIDVHNGRVYHR